MKRKQIRKKRIFLLTVGCLGLALFFSVKKGRPVRAQEVSYALSAAQEKEESNKIHNHVFIGTVDVSGMTAEEARGAVQAYVNQLGGDKVTLVNKDTGEKLTLTAGDFGLSWKDPDMVEYAVELGKRGNAVSRYKAIKDLNASGEHLPLSLSVDSEEIAGTLQEKCASFVSPAVNFGLKRVGSSFEITEGRAGYEIDEKKAEEAIRTALTKNWAGGDDTEIPLSVVKEEPKGNRESLEQVKDVLGTFTTSYATSGAARCKNIANGCRLINGATIYPGEEFSTLKAISPFTEANGYELAGSYLNGTVVESFGGGICQVSTTLYNACLKSELEIKQRQNHSMIVNYVKPSMDAAIAESSGKDFRFVNNTDAPIYIEGRTVGKSITFTIYGCEKRDPNREVSYESETLQTIDPVGVQVTMDATKPAGFARVTQSAHTGYKAQLWKVVKENGQQVSREVINHSSYMPAKKILTVGTAGANPASLEQLKAAVATGDEATITQAAGALASAPQTPEQTPLAAAQAAVVAANAQAQAAVQSGDPNAIAAAQAAQAQAAAALAAAQAGTQ